VTPEPARPARDLVVYASGGGRRGSFGAGALHALAGMGLRAVYGISAGALNGAQFALGSTMAAVEWYLHHVIEHGILAKATAVRLLRGEDMVDIPEAERVLAHEHLVDGDALSRCAFPVCFGAVERESLAQFLAE
jgi:predicted acylesterase/phospholipase RssA